jgi:hypothetical protein
MIAIGAGRASKLLSCLKSGMLQVNEIKPTVVTSTDERFVFSKSKGGERASIICNPNANDHVVLVDQPMGGYNYCGDRDSCIRPIRKSKATGPAGRLYCQRLPSCKVRLGRRRKAAAEALRRRPGGNCTNSRHSLGAIAASDKRPGGFKEVEVFLHTCSASLKERTTPQILPDDDAQIDDKEKYNNVVHKGNHRLYRLGTVPSGYNFRGELSRPCPRLARSNRSGTLNLPQAGPGSCIVNCWRRESRFSYSH